MAPGYLVPAPFLSEGLLLDLLAVSLTGVNVLRPFYGPGGELDDFVLEYLNPAAQRMAGLPERPGITLRGQFPYVVAADVLDYYRRVYEGGTSTSYEVNYQADGLDNYFRLAARRSGEWLLVSFTDTSDQSRTAVELALRESHAAEQTARAEAERQRQRFHEVLLQLPAHMAVYHGPDHVYQFVNPPYQRRFPHRSFAGRPFREGTPEAQELGVVALFDQVYQTGKPYYAHEMEGWFDFRGTGELEQLFFNLYLQPLRDAQGRIDGVFDFSYDVTEQVRARRQVEQLNQELEARVRERTEQALEARTEAEAQQAELRHVFEQAPVAIAIVRGPDFVVELANPVMSTLWGRPLAQVLGRPLFEALPDTRGQGLEQIFAQVLETGETFAATEMPVTLAREQAGLPAQGYFNCSWQPWRDAQGGITGLIIVGVEVTEQVHDRQRAEALQAEVLAAARHQSQEREAFHQIFEQTPALIALLRAPGHRFEYVNPAYQRLFPGRQLVGLDMAAAVPEVREQGFVALLDRVYETGETYFGAEHLFVVPAHQGQPVQEVYFNFTYQAYQEDGQTAGISIFAYDVTGQVRARQEREAQREQLHQLFMRAPAPIVILDGPELVFQLVNPAYQQIFPGRALLGKPLPNALPELVGTAIPGLVEQVYRTGASYVAQELPLMMARHEGGPLEEIFWTFNYEARRDTGGVVDGVLVFAHDVTEQVRARRRTEDAAAELRLLTAHTPAFLFRTDAAGHLTYLNQSYFEWSGVDGNQLATLDESWAAVHPEDAAGLRAEFGIALAAHRPWESPMYRLRRADGHYRWVLTRTQPVFRPEGHVDGHNGITLEIHDQHELQRQLQRTNVDLDNFIYTASHDLKAPIANIEGLLLALEQEMPTAGRVGDVPLMLELMQGAVERFKRTITHLTDVSRLQKEYSQPTHQVLLSVVIAEVQLDLAPLVAESQARIEVVVDACPAVSFSEKNLRSVVYNLLSNALKYRHPDRTPQVRISCRCEDDYQVLEVQDNGLGLDLVRGQDQLFGMFQRLHSHVEGTGIGLYMVKKMVENAGGRIQVRSQIGHGSTFAVYFPQ